MSGRPEPSKPASENRQKASAESGGERRGGVRRGLLIGLVASLCVITVAAALITFFTVGGSQAGRLAETLKSTVPSHSQTHSSQARSLQPTAPAASRPDRTAPKVVSDKVAKHVLTWPPQLKYQVQHWEAGAGGTTLARIEMQMGTAMQLAGVKMYATMRQACVTLASDVNSARTEPPIPDTAMQQLYLKALAGLSLAATNCQNAIFIKADGETERIHVDQALLYRARLEFAAMSEKLYRATAAVTSLQR